MLHTQQAGSRGKRKNLKVEKKEKEEQRLGSAPGAPRLPGRSLALAEQGPYSGSPPQSGPDPPQALSTAARVSW